MQLKLNNHLVDTAKTETSWNQWLVSSHGKTVQLLIFEDGTMIANAKDHAEFESACIRPLQTDRACAAAEVSLREIVSELKTHGRSLSRLEQSHGVYGLVISPEI